MELEMNRMKRILSFAGLLSFLTALVALAGLNIGLLLDGEEFPDFFLIRLPMIGLALGIVGLFANKRSRHNAIWGIGLCLFIYLFTFLMFGLAWIINTKP